jgi:hypothetical protein
MDARELKRRAEKAREFHHPEDGFSFTLRVPGSVAMRAMLRAATEAGKLNFDTLFRLLTPGCVVAWEGPTAGHVVKDLPEEEAKQPLPCERELVEEFLGDRAVLMDKLAGAVVAKYNEREAAKEAAAKNS